MPRKSAVLSADIPATVARPAAGVPAAGVPTDFAARVVAWQRVHGRHDLPWQNTRDPYRIWLSEIMLQQTQVSAVIEYFQRFVGRLPTVAALAEASADEVMALWAGLGYYSRARNLHRCAKAVMSEHGGVFPSDPEVLVTLPGIGRSTAAAVAAFSAGVRSPILDGNVKRVLARYQAQDGYPGEPKVAKRLWDTAERFTPRERVNHYTQAMMDLGATLCTRTRPSCLLCPLREGCRAHQLGRETDYPESKPRKELPQKRTLMPLLASRDGAILLYRRPASGLWGGLWSLPELDDLAALDPLAARHALELGERRALPGLTHTFSHFQLAIEPWLIRVEQASPVMAEADWLWYNLATPPRLGLAAPVKKLLKRAQAELQQPTL